MIYYTKGCFNSYSKPHALPSVFTEQKMPGVIISPTLTLKVPNTTAADNTLDYFLHCISDKIMLDISRESSAWQSVVCYNFAWRFKG